MTKPSERIYRLMDEGNSIGRAIVAYLDERVHPVAGFADGHAYIAAHRGDRPVPGCACKACEIRALVGNGCHDFSECEPAPAPEYTKERRPSFDGPSPDPWQKNHQRSVAQTSQAGLETNTMSPEKSHPAPASPPSEDKPGASKSAWELEEADAKATREQFALLKGERDELRARLEVSGARCAMLGASVATRNNELALHAGDAEKLSHYRDKAHLYRREVRRLNAALRMAGLVAREQATKLRLSAQNHELARVMFVAKVDEYELRAKLAEQEAFAPAPTAAPAEEPKT